MDTFVHVEINEEPVLPLPQSQGGISGCQGVWMTGSGDSSSQELIVLIMEVQIDHS